MLPLPSRSSEAPRSSILHAVLAVLIMAPIACPSPPGSPSGAFVLDAEE
jgi:hypothetical protein